MRIYLSRYLFISLTLTLLLSCGDDDDAGIPSETQVTINNTLQADVTTNGEELPFESIFMLPENEWRLTASVEDAVEFPGYVIGLYDIDIDENSIRYDLVAAADDPVYSQFFRTIEANTFDRYYLTFDVNHNVTSYTSSDPSVSLIIESDKVLVVEITEGWNFNPGSTFTLTLN